MPRRYFDQELDRLHNRVVEMGQLVETELQQALQALKTLDKGLAKQVIESDQEVNATRFSIEDDCFKLIATQQPLAGDLRLIIAVMNIIVDLEQIGDKAKDIAATIRQVKRFQKTEKPSELYTMGELVSTMLKQSIQAYAEADIELAKQVASREVEVDQMLDVVVNDVIERMAKEKKEKKVTVSVGILGVAQHLERIGDLITNVVERIIYIATGSVQEIDVDHGLPG
ncbi:MAG: phosphate signaling complex protein PhoU [Anaerolineae bacterium]|nr:phosphate signaling complex protein PhoU [Anaerolineae bacterium]